MDYSALENKSK